MIGPVFLPKCRYAKVGNIKGSAAREDGTASQKTGQS